MGVREILIAIAACLATAIALWWSSRRRLEIPGVATSTALALIGGVAVAELVGPGPIVVMMGVGLAAGLLTVFAPQATPLSLSVFGLVRVAVAAALGGVCRAPTSWTAMLLAAAGGTVVAWTIGREGWQHSRLQGLVDSAAVGFSVTALTIWTLTPVGGLVVGYEPSPLWLLLIPAVALAALADSRVGDPALPILVAALGLIAARAVMTLRSGLCAGPGYGVLVTSSFAAFAVVATHALRGSGRVPRPWRRGHEAAH